MIVNVYFLRKTVPLFAENIQVDGNVNNSADLDTECQIRTVAGGAVPVSVSDLRTDISRRVEVVGVNKRGDENKNVCKKMIYGLNLHIMKECYDWKF